MPDQPPTSTQTEWWWGIVTATAGIIGWAFKSRFRSQNRIEEVREKSLAELADTYTEAIGASLEQAKSQGNGWQQLLAATQELNKRLFEENQAMKSERLQLILEIEHLKVEIQGLKAQLNLLHGGK